MCVTCRYKDAPSLPSLESIYREEYEREQAKTSALEAAENAETGKKHVPGYPKPKMDVAGTVWAEGRRKSAVGQVRSDPCTTTHARIKDRSCAVIVCTC